MRLLHQGPWMQPDESAVLGPQLVASPIAGGLGVALGAAWAPAGGCGAALRAACAMATHPQHHLQQ